MTEGYAPHGDEVREIVAPLLVRGRHILDDHRLQITKDWLGRIVSQIDDLGTLERFPTHESIQVSVDLISGLAQSLCDDGVLADFAPQGTYYQKAAVLGEVQAAGAHGLLNISQSMQALENAIWSLLIDALRKDDRDLLDMVVRLRTALHGIANASLEAYYRRASSELDRLAHTDQLTGLFNRRYLVQQLERHVEIFKRYRHPFALLMLDLDELKSINDTYGHAAGDMALRHIATLMSLNVRDVDICCRFGGDEFIVLMPETGNDVVEVVGGRFLDSLAKTKLKVDSALLTLRVSVGHASCPEDGRDAEELLQQADLSLYRAKQQKATSS